MALLRGLVDLFAVIQDRSVSAIMALRRRHEFQAAVLVLMVVGPKADLQRTIRLRTPTSSPKRHAQCHMLYAHFASMMNDWQN